MKHIQANHRSNLLKHEVTFVDLDKTKDVPDKVLPIFITVDPARDDVKTVAEYIKGQERDQKLFSIPSYEI